MFFDDKRAVTSPPRRHHRTIVSVLALTVAAAGALGVHDGSVAADTVYEINRLPDGTHLGVGWFSPPEPATVGAVNAHWLELSRTSSVGRVMVDWTDVEATRGVYDLAYLTGQLASLDDAGLAPMVTIAAVDASGTPWPAWLGEFDAIAGSAAYNAMLDEVLPTLADHGVWLLAIANEPPFDDGEFDRAGFATFVEHVASHVHDVAPDLAVTFTFAGTDVLVDDPDIHRLVDAVDVLSVNHYCLGSDLRAERLEHADQRIDDIVRAADDKPVVFQELGCPASDVNGSSEQFQADWFAAVFAHIATIEQIRAAFVFEFLDWSPVLFDAGYGPVLDEIAQEAGVDYVDRFREWLLTTGLVRRDGTTRPAFAVYLQVAR